MRRRSLGPAIVLTGLLSCGTAVAEISRLERGEYLLHAGGCTGCHTADEKNASPLAGGHRLDTPFGTFFPPNITPDVATGIGGWSDDEFLDAMWHGVDPDGSPYYPAFPYTSYTGMSREDVLAIKEYLFSLTPVRRENPEHDLAWYLSTRLMASTWQWLYFTPERFTPDPGHDESWNRGAYLVRHVSHCGECHTPRNAFGKMMTENELAGNTNGPGGKKVPDITPNRETGIGRWSQSEIEFFLQIGMLPDGDFTGGAMSPVIDDVTGRLSADDRNAIAIYLKSVPASSRPAADN